MTYREEAQWATLNEARECAEVIAIKGSCGIASAIESLVNSQAESKLGATSGVGYRPWKYQQARLRWGHENGV